MEQPVYHLSHVVKEKSERTDFDGPLDLILHLLSKNKMEISDIQISLILEQYLAWMEKQRELDLEVTGEFVAMSSQLIFIKTRMLLNIRDEEALSEMDELKAQLQARRNRGDYLRIRAAAEALQKRGQTAQDYISKAPEPLEADRTYRWVHCPEDLVRGLKNAVMRSGNSMLPPVSSFVAIVGKEPYPVEEKAGELLRILNRGGVVRFGTLFCGCRSRSEAVAVFLAVLELCRQGRISLAGTAEDCTVTAADGADSGEEAAAALPAAGE